MNTTNEDSFWATNWTQTSRSNCLPLQGFHIPWAFRGGFTLTNAFGDVNTAAWSIQFLHPFGASNQSQTWQLFSRIVLINFFKQRTLSFPFQTVPLYLHGTSYGGKAVAVFSSHLKLVTADSWFLSHQPHCHGNCWNLISHQQANRSSWGFHVFKLPLNVLKIRNLFAGNSAKKSGMQFQRNFHGWWICFSVQYDFWRVRTGLSNGKSLVLHGKKSFVTTDFLLKRDNLWTCLLIEQRDNLPCIFKACQSFQSLIDDNQRDHLEGIIDKAQEAYNAEDWYELDVKYWEYFSTLWQYNPSIDIYNILNAYAPETRETPFDNYCSGQAARLFVPACVFCPIPSTRRLFPALKPIWNKTPISALQLQFTTECLNWKTLWTEQSERRFKLFQTRCLGQVGPSPLRHEYSLWFSCAGFIFSNRACFALFQAHLRCSIPWKTRVDLYSQPFLTVSSHSCTRSQQFYSGHIAHRSLVSPSCFAPLRWSILAVSEGLRPSEQASSLVLLEQNTQKSHSVRLRQPMTVILNFQWIIYCKMKR